MMSGDHKPHFKRAVLAPASEGPLGVKFDEDGARSPGSSTGHNPHALLALFGRTTIRRAGRLVGCCCHEHTVCCQYFRSKYSSASFQSHLIDAPPETR